MNTQEMLDKANHILELYHMRLLDSVRLALDDFESIATDNDYRGFVAYLWKLGEEEWANCGGKQLDFGDDLDPRQSIAQDFRDMLGTLYKEARIG